MKLLLLYFSIVIFSLSTSAQNAQASMIVGGRDALPEEFPWMVELISNNDHQSGGTLIAPDWVITAAHCVKAVPMLGITAPERVIINNITLAEADAYSEEINIDEIMYFPSYDLSIPNLDDIALIRLETPSTNTPILMNINNPNIAQISDTVITMGWGLEVIGGSTVNFLKVAQPTIKAINSKTIHAGFNIGEDEQGAAAGDSGGPLIANTVDGLKIIGLVSGGTGPTTTAGNPGIFTRIYGYKNWIDSLMNIEPVGLQEENSQNSTIFQDETGEVFLSISEDLTKNIKYSMTNMIGQVVENGIIEKGETVQKINTSNIKQGVYILNIENELQSSFKFVKR